MENADKVTDNEVYDGDVASSIDNVCLLVRCVALATRLGQRNVYRHRIVVNQVYTVYIRQS